MGLELAHLPTIRSKFVCFTFTYCVEITCVWTFLRKNIGTFSEGRGFKSHVGLTLHLASKNLSLAVCIFMHGRIDFLFAILKLAIITLHIVYLLFFVERLCHHHTEIYWYYGAKDMVFYSFHNFFWGVISFINWAANFTSVNIWKKCEFILSLAVIIRLRRPLGTWMLMLHHVSYLKTSARPIWNFINTLFLEMWYDTFSVYCFLAKHRTKWFNINI